MLKKVGNKYLIHNDIFYNFSAGQNIYMSQPDRTFNQEQTPLSMPIHAPPIAQMSPSSLPNTPQSYAFSPNPAPVNGPTAVYPVPGYPQQQPMPQTVEPGFEPPPMAPPGQNQYMPPPSPMNQQIPLPNDNPYSSV